MSLFKRTLLGVLAAGTLLLNAGVALAQEAMEDPNAIPMAQPATEDPNAVPIAQSQFVIPELVVPVGTTVTWVNLDPETHDAIDMAFGSFGSVFESGPIEPGMTFSFTFLDPGYYPYTCTYHADQTGVINVVE